MEKGWRAFMAAALVVAIGLTVTIATWSAWRLHEFDKASVEFERVARQRAERLRERLDLSLNGMRALQALLTAYPAIDRPGFRRFAGALLAQTTQVKALEWVPRIAPDAVDATEASARREGLAAYRIHPLPGATAPAPEADRFPVHYIEPLAGNEPALGADLASDDVRREAMERARDDAAEAATAPVVLVQEKARALGVLVFDPVYGAPDVPAGVEDRRAALKGFALAVIRAPEIAEGDPGAGADLSVVTITDRQAPEATRVLYAGSAPEAGAEAHRDDGIAPHVRELMIGGRTWTVEIRPSDLFRRRIAHWESWTILAFGLVVTALSALYVHAARRQRRELEQAMRERTNAWFKAEKAHFDARKRAEELAVALRSQTTLQEQLVQSEKMVALGSLAGGVAHEINTPMQYIGDNLRFLQTGVADLLKALDLRRSAMEGAITRPEAETALAGIDVAFIAAEAPSAIDQALEGADRVTRIVNAIKEYSHPGNKIPQPFDFNASIQTVVLVTRNQWKYVAEVSCDLDPDLPPLTGLKQEIEQVLLNLIVNAAQAIAEQSRDQPGAIAITTRRADANVILTVRDDGPGIPPENLSRIFDMFFTTKPPGSGTGQGLAICQSIIMRHHGGVMSVESTPGHGATFTITLPLSGPAGPAVAAEAPSP